jgi:hypothetical protein
MEGIKNFISGGMQVKECPVCHLPMDEVAKSGILIDVCPRCKGVWLDRGELSKLLETARGYHEYDDYEENRYHSPHHDHYFDKQYHKYKGHHKKHGLAKLLKEIFD